MNAWQFMSDSPWLAWLLAWPALFIVLALAGVAGEVCKVGTKQFFRWLRVRKHGWPPPHLDADGDFERAKTAAEDAPEGQGA